MSKRTKFTSEQIADLVMQLNGEIEPIGETNTDDQRYENLCTLLDVTNTLLDEVAKVLPNAKRHEHSMWRAGDCVWNWLKCEHEWIGEMLDE